MTISFSPSSELHFTEKTELSLPSQQQSSSSALRSSITSRQPIHEKSPPDLRQFHPKAEQSRGPLPPRLPTDNNPPSFLKPYPSASSHTPPTQPSSPHPPRLLQQKQQTCHDSSSSKILSPPSKLAKPAPESPNAARARPRARKSRSAIRQRRRETSALPITHQLQPPEKQKTKREGRGRRNLHSPHKPAQNPQAARPGSALRGKSNRTSSSAGYLSSGRGR